MNLKWMERFEECAEEAIKELMRYSESTHYPPLIHGRSEARGYWRPPGIPMYPQPGPWEAGLKEYYKAWSRAYKACAALDDAISDMILWLHRAAENTAKARFDLIGAARKQAEEEGAKYGWPESWVTARVREILKI